MKERTTCTRENSLEILITEHVTGLGLYKVLMGIQPLFMIVPSTRLVSVHWEETKPGGAAIAVSGSVTAALGSNTAFTSKVGNICCAFSVEKRIISLKSMLLRSVLLTCLNALILNTLLMSLLELLEELISHYVRISPRSDTAANDIFIVIRQGN